MFLGFKSHPCGIYRQKITSVFEKKVGKIDVSPKKAVLSVLCNPQDLKYSDLRFDRIKPSHITNIHCKFEDFFPRNLRIIKVLHSTSHIIRRTGKMIKINSNIAFSGQIFDRELKYSIFTDRGKILNIGKCVADGK